MKRILKKNLSKEIDRLNREEKKLDLQNEIYKKNISEQIKNFSKEDIVIKKNPDVKYSLWQRLIKVLGIN
jgi:hypothetical protein